MENDRSKISGDTIMEYYLSKTNDGKDESAKERVGKQIRSLFPVDKKIRVRAAFFAAIWIMLTTVVAFMFLSEGVKRFDGMLLSVGVLIVLQCICVVFYLSTMGEASIYDMLLTYKSKHGNLPSSEEAVEIINGSKEKQEEVQLLEKEFGLRAR